MLGNHKVELPEGHTWKSYARLLLDSLPPPSREQYEAKISQFLRWYADRGYGRGIPDEADPALEASRKVPSWRRICKTILKNDFWCKSLSFSQHRSGKHEAYLKRVKKWNQLNARVRRTMQRR